MIDAYQRGDLAGALDLANEILSDDPDHGVAFAHASEYRTLLERDHLAVLGGGDSVLEFAVGGPLREAALREPHVAFLCSLFDAGLTVTEVLDVCGSKRVEVLALLHALVEKHVLKVR